MTGKLQGYEMQERKFYDAGWDRFTTSFKAALRCLIFERALFVGTKRRAFEKEGKILLGINVEKESKWKAEKTYWFHHPRSCLTSSCSSGSSRSSKIEV